MGRTIKLHGIHALLFWLSSNMGVSNNQEALIQTPHRRAPIVRTNVHKKDPNLQKQQFRLVSCQGSKGQSKVSLFQILNHGPF